jgi:hypothetical protein
MTRRRYVMVDGELVEVDEDFDNARPQVPVIGDRHYDGLCATDGADISTRVKHRAYMKRNGLTTVDDYKNEWQEAQARRERFYALGYDPTRNADVARAVHALKIRGGKSRR